VVQVPSLNGRREDIPMLIRHFNEQICAEYGIAPKHFEPQAIEALQEQNWTGNIRELRNVVERLLILSQERVVLSDVQRYVYTDDLVIS